MNEQQIQSQFEQEVLVLVQSSFSQQRKVLDELLFWANALVQQRASRMNQLGGYSFLDGIVLVESSIVLDNDTFSFFGGAWADAVALEPVKVVVSIDFSNVSIVSVDTYFGDADGVGGTMSDIELLHYNNTPIRWLHQSPQSHSKNRE